MKSGFLGGDRTFPFGSIYPTTCSLRWFQTNAGFLVSVFIYRIHHLHTSYAYAEQVVNFSVFHLFLIWSTTNVQKLDCLGSWMGYTLISFRNLFTCTFKNKMAWHCVRHEGIQNVLFPQTGWNNNIVVYPWAHPGQLRRCKSIYLHNLWSLRSSSWKTWQFNLDGVGNLENFGSICK